MAEYGRRDRQQWRKHFQGKTTPIDRRYNKQNHQKNTQNEKTKKHKKNKKNKKTKDPATMSPPTFLWNLCFFLFFFVGFFGFQLWSLMCKEFCSWGLPVGDAMLKWQVQPYFFSGWVDSWRKVAKGDCPKRGRSQRCFQIYLYIYMYSSLFK